jgi:hypothetical protein
MVGAGVSRKGAKVRKDAKGLGEIDIAYNTADSAIAEIARVTKSVPFTWKFYASFANLRAFA